MNIVVQKVKILLDANFLLTMVRHKIHGFSDIRSKIPADFYTLSGVLNEIAGLAKSDKKIKNEARLVEDLVAKSGVTILQSTLPAVDQELISLSSEYVIATNDKELRRKVAQKGGKTIFIRSLTYIDVEDLLEQ